MGNKGRWEYLRAIYERYRKAGRKAKKVILSEFCANTGYHRKYAIRLLNGPRPEKRRTRRERRRGLSYSPETLALLTAVWEAAGYPWSVRLKALLPLWLLPWIRKRFRVRPEIAKQLLKISPRQMGPPAESAEDAAATADLRAHQAGLSAQAPHSGEDRSLGRGDSWFHGSGSGFAFGPFRQRRVRAYAQCHRHAQHLDGIASGAGTRGRGRPARFK